MIKKFLGLDRTDKDGFPKPKCKGLIDPLGNCVEGSDPEQQITIIDGSLSAYENIKNALEYYGKTVGAVGVNKVLDILSVTLLGIDSKNLDKDKIIEAAEKKIKVLQALKDDPETRKILSELASTIIEIIAGTSVDAGVPIQRALSDLAIVAFESMEEATDSAVEFVENSIKLLPGIGDAYIILQNTGSSVLGLSNAAKTSVDIGNIWLDATDRIGKNLVKRLDLTNEQMTKLFDNINAIKDLEKRIEGDLGNKIQKSGSFLGDTIRSLTPTSIVKDISPPVNTVDNLQKNLSKEVDENSKRLFGFGESIKNARDNVEKELDDTKNNLFGFGKSLKNASDNVEKKLDNTKRGLFGSSGLFESSNSNKDVSNKVNNSRKSRFSFGSKKSKGGKVKKRSRKNKK